MDIIFLIIFYAGDETSRVIAFHAAINSIW